MATDFVKEIKDTEEKAAAMIRAAEETGHQNLSLAEIEQARLINEARNHAESIRQEAVAKAKSEAEQLKSKIAAETEQAIAQLKQIVANRIESAINFIIKKVKEEWGWQESKKS
ncbi:MAG: hypothetical protein ABIK67_08370 [candidate division WOR-3 bacterium]